MSNADELTAHPDPALCVVETVDELRMGLNAGLKRGPAKTETGVFAAFLDQQSLREIHSMGDLLSWVDVPSTSGA